MRPDTPFQGSAFAAGRNNFLPSPGARGRSRDKLRATCQSIVLTASHWRGPSNRGYRVRLDVRPMRLADWQRPRAAVLFRFVQFPIRTCLLLVRDAESPQPRSLGSGARSPITDERVASLDLFRERALAEPARKQTRASPYRLGRG